MACSSIALTNIAKECRNSSGGIKDIWIILADDVTSVAVDSTTEMVTGITLASGKTYSHWQFNAETANAASTTTVDNAAGTMFVQTDLALQFSKMENVKRLQIKAATVDFVKVIFRDNNGKLFFLGYDNPVYASASTGNTGTAMGDLNGYNITLTDISKDMPMEVSMDADDLEAIGIVL